MKAEAVKIKEKFFYFAKNYPLRMVFIKFMCFVAGIIISKGNIFGVCYPFGISFSASIPGKFVAPTVIGAAAGYLFPLNLSLGIRYISTLISITAVRWTLSDFTKIKNHFLYIPMVVFCSSFVTNLAVLSSEGFEPKDVFLSIMESLIAAGAACFFERTFKILLHKKIYNLNIREFTCVILSLNIILLSFSGFSFLDISIGRILALLSILVSAYISGVEGGAIAGVASGVIFSLPAFGFGYISSSYAFGGMVAGLFSNFGKFGVSIAFMFSALLIAFQSGDSVRLICGIYEMLIAIFVYLLIPCEVLNKFKITNRGAVSKENLKQVLAQKLHFASKSVNSVPVYVEKAFWDVFKPESNFINIKSECVNSVYKTCKCCKKAPICWGENASKTSDFFGNMIESINTGKKFSFNLVSFDFCENRNTIIGDIQENYNRFGRQNNAKANLCKFKKSISEQMYAVSSVIEDFAESSDKKLIVKEEVSNYMIKELDKCGITVLRLVCYQNDKEKMFIDIECDSTLANKFSGKVIDKMSEICGKNLSSPIINNYGTTSRIQLCEAKKYSVDFGFTQHAFCEGLVCGDSFCKFEDGEGNFNVIISDGMGTGDAAAIQGNITAELMKNFIKSGIGAGSAVKFVNSALLLNESEEILSTLDMISVNLFDGNAKFLKAGSPPTFIVRGDEIIKVNAQSLPVGILSETNISFDEFDLREGDFVVMFSDGVTDIGEDWIFDIIKSKNYENAKELSKRIVKKAIDIRKENNHDDDITCIAMRLAS